MKQRSLSPTWLLFILTGLNLFNYLDRYVVGAVLAPIQLDFGLSDEQAGRLNTAFMFGYFLTSPFFGYLGDRMSRKWLIAAGIFVWSVGTVLTGVATGFVALLGFRVLTGFGEASYASISPSLISDAYGSDKRNNALTIFYVAMPVGAALGMLVGSQIGATWGWRYAFIAAGLPGLALAVSFLPFAEPRRGAADTLSTEPIPKPVWADVFKLLRLTDYNLVVFGYAAYTYATAAFNFWGATYMIHVYGMSLKSAGRYFSGVIAAAGLVSAFAGGFAATAWRKRNPAAYSLTLGLSTLASVPLAVAAFLAPSKTQFMIALAAAIMLLFLGTGPVNTLIVETVPINLRASAMAMSIFIIHLFGDFWSPQIMGWLSVRFGSLRRAAMLLPALLLVAAILWCTLALKTLRNRKVISAAASSRATIPAID
jgi:MFS family permease